MLFSHCAFDTTVYAVLECIPCYIVRFPVVFCEGLLGERGGEERFKKGKQDHMITKIGRAIWKQVWGLKPPHSKKEIQHSFRVTLRLLTWEGLNRLCHLHFGKTFP